MENRSDKLTRRQLVAVFVVSLLSALPWLVTHVPWASY